MLVFVLLLVRVVCPKRTVAFVAREVSSWELMGPRKDVQCNRRRGVAASDLCVQDWVVVVSKYTMVVVFGEKKQNPQTRE